MTDFNKSIQDMLPLKEYFFQVKYDTMKDASCGGVYKLKGDNLQEARNRLQVVYDRIGCQNPKIVAIYGRNPSIDEIDAASDFFKKNESIVISDDVVA